MSLAGNTNGPVSTFGDVLDSGDSFTFALLKIKGQDQNKASLGKASLCNYYCEILL